MHYTSGTTGRPKGVRRPLSGLDPDAAAELLSALPQLFGITAGPPNVHLVTSPHYHTAVTVFGGGAAQMGHCVVYMDSWDAEQALALVERYRVTNTHMVPTQFKRLLALPEEVRRAVRLSVDALAAARGRALPGGDQARDARLVGAAGVRVLRGHRGRRHDRDPAGLAGPPGHGGPAVAVSEIMIADDDGNECPPGVAGAVYMRMTLPDFVYKGDPAKTEANRLRGYFTVGDIGYLDAAASCSCATGSAT
jgi:long-chain acyl-CoA synthetase